MILTFPLLGPLLLAAQAAGASGPELGAHVATLAGVESPGAVAFGPRGRVYVVETGRHRVRAFDAAGSELAAFGARGSGPGELLFPGGIAVAPGGAIFVADTGNHRVQVFAADGAYLREWGGLGAAPGRFHTPRGVAANGERVAVADVRNERVQVFDHAGLLALTVTGTDAAPLARPMDVALDDAGRLFVADGDRHRVLAFDAAGRLLAEWGDWGWPPGLFSVPSGIDARGGSVFVADLENHRVQVFDPSGALQYKWGLHAIRPREGRGKLHYPADVAVAPGGDLAAVAEPIDDRVQLFGPSTGELDEIDRMRQTFVQASPHYGFDMDAAGVHMAIVEPETHKVSVFDLQWVEPRLLAKIGGYGTAMGLFVRPTGVHLDAASRTLTVCDTGNRRLQVLRLRVDPEAEVRQDPGLAAFERMLDFELLGRRLGDVELEWTIEPVAVARRSDGAFYVLDAKNERVFVFDARLAFVASFGGHGTGPGRFRAPSALRFGPAEDVLYVVDAHNRRVQAFSPAGEHRFEFGAGAAAGGALDLPHGVAVDAAGAVYVSDAGRHRVAKYDAQGRLIATIGSRGIRRLEFYKPRGVAMSGANELYVLDHANHRIVWLSTEGEYGGCFGPRLYTKPARLPDTYDPKDYAE